MQCRLPGFLSMSSQVPKIARSFSNSSQCRNSRLPDPDSDIETLMLLDFEINKLEVS